jgi:hypothetical protein
LTDVEPLLATAPKGATLVVFHTAVLAYVTARQQRDAFAAMMKQNDVVWISNEASRLFSVSDAKGAPKPPGGHFVMSVNGKPVAWTGPHGQSIDWIGTSD